jgi:dUTP pyrophosphatase
MNVKISLAEPRAKLPTKSTEGAFCWDLYVPLSAPHRVIGAGDVCCVSTGLKMEIPPGYEVQIRPRSGLAVKEGVTVLNSPGCVDSDFRGTVCVILTKLNKIGGEFFVIQPGQRIAQMCIVKAPDIGIELTAEELSETSRGEGGFGSTGK